MSTENGVILIADDEPFNLEIVSELLEDAGFEAVLIENGVEAWRLLDEGPERFDAVLLDRMMPGMDGLELLGRIKADPRMEELPVILQTARAGKQDVAEGLEAGAFSYLSKPFDKAMLIDVVTRAVADRREANGSRAP